MQKYITSVITIKYSNPKYCCISLSWGQSPGRLTHWGLVTPHDDTDWVNTGSVNGLLPDSTSHYLKPCWLIISEVLWHSQGPWFNIKMSSCQYGKSHCGDKTVVRSSYLHNGISYTGKMTSLYWIRALVEISQEMPTDGNFKGNSQQFYPWSEFENLISQLHLPGTNELTTIENCYWNLYQVKINP